MQFWMKKWTFRNSCSLSNQKCLWSVFGLKAGNSWLLGRITLCLAGEVFAWALRQKGKASLRISWVTTEEHWGMLREEQSEDDDADRSTPCLPWDHQCYKRFLWQTAANHKQRCGCSASVKKSCRNIHQALGRAFMKAHFIWCKAFV